MRELDSHPSANSGYNPITAEHHVTDFFGHNHGERHDHPEKLTIVGEHGGNRRSIAHPAQQERATIHNGVEGQPMVDMDQIRQGREVMGGSEAQLSEGLAHAGEFVVAMRHGELSAHTIAPLGAPAETTSSGIPIADIQAVSDASSQFAGAGY